MNITAVISPGQKVKMEDGLVGLVTAVCFRGPGLVTCEVVWWNGRSRCCDWLASNEVTPLNPDTPLFQIGMH